MSSIDTNIDINKLQNPYSNKILSTRILVPCTKLNSDIYLNIKNILKNKYEGNCIKYGYISKIFKILDYSENNIDINNLDCSVSYFVKYSARLCYPVENTLIIAKIITMNKQFFVAENGPITNMIKYNNVNESKFKLDEQHNIIIKKTKKKLDIGNYVKIQIQAKKMYNNDNKIGTLSYLMDIPTQNEIDNFYEKKNRTEDVFDAVNIAEDLNEDTVEDVSDNELVNSSEKEESEKSEDGDDSEFESSKTNFISI